MKITISSGKHDDPRDVTVEDGGEKLASFKAKDIAEAHKMLAQGRKDGWDSLKPAGLAAQTKAATKTETERVEAGKAKSEPKKDR